MFSVTYTGKKLFPLCTLKFKPTNSGVIVERRDHVCIGFLIFSYLAYRLIWPLRSQKILAAGLLVLLALGAFKFPMIRLLGGARFFAPELPGWCLHLAGFLYGWVLFCFVLMVVAELGRGVWFLYCRKSGRKGLSQKGQEVAAIFLLPTISPPQDSQT